MCIKKYEILDVLKRRVNKSKRREEEKKTRDVGSLDLSKII